MDNTNNNSTGNDSKKTEKRADFFDMVTLKQSYPKVKINLLANLHQEKVIMVIQDEDNQAESSQSQKEEYKGSENELTQTSTPTKQQQASEDEVDVFGQRDNSMGIHNSGQKQRTEKETLHQDNIFEVEMQVDSDVEGGIDLEQDCIHGFLKFLQVPSYQVPDSSLSDQEMTRQLMMEIQSINIRIYRQEISGMQISNDSELQNVVNSFNRQQYYM